jgi:hypothetical protein
MATAAQLARQKASNRKMRSQGYRIFEQPLYVSDDAEAVIRSPHETLRRAMILWLLGCCADETPHAEIRESMERCGLMPDLSPAEAEYMATPFHDEQTDTNMKWNLESSWVLLWSLKRLWWLNSPDTLCGCGRMEGILRRLESAEGMQRTFEMQSKARILDLLDLTLRQHWAVRDDYVRGVHGIPPLFGRVVERRHHALLWLTSTTPWDEVETHT